MLGGKLLVISSVVLLIIYGFAMFLLDLSITTYAVFHLLFAFFLVFILTKLVRTQESSFMFGIKLSLIVGVILLGLNYLLLGLGDRIDIPYLESVPNPLLYFVLFLIIFNIPFLFYSGVSVAKTFGFALIIILVLLVVPIIYSAVTLDCPSLSCSLTECFCSYSFGSEECPSCSDYCSGVGKEVVSAKSYLTALPDVKGIFKESPQCSCNCG